VRVRECAMRDDARRLSRSSFPRDQVSRILRDTEIFAIIK